VSFWGGRKLFNELSSNSIVAPFDPKLIDCNSYTLRMGEEYYVTPDTDTWLRKNKKELLREPRLINTPLGSFSRRGGSLVIPSGQFAFLLTEEVVSMPRNVMGFISLKSATKFRGLINVSGFHVDPGYQGNLIYSVFNAGPGPIHIQRQEPLFLLWFADLSGRVEAKYYKSMPVPQLEIPIRLISDVAREVPSIQRVSERLETLERRVSLIFAAATIIVALVGLYLAYLQLRPETPLPPPAPPQTEGTAPGATLKGLVPRPKT
jgi:dCTP deaminase